MNVALPLTHRELPPEMELAFGGAQAYREFLDMIFQPDHEEFRALPQLGRQAVPYRSVPFARRQSQVVLDALAGVTKAIAAARFKVL